MIRSVKLQRCVWILCLVLLGGLLAWLSSFQYVGDPVFSHGAGFYEEDILLEISASNAAKIYYTLDGSVPDKNALEYTGPILLTNASEKENGHAMRTDLSAGFYSDLIDQYQVLDGHPGYTPPDFLIDKCTVVRVVAYSPDESVSEISSASYFVGLSAADYDGCSILSVYTDSANLFDSKTGIYVTGDILETYLQSEEIAVHWHEWEANYRQRGSDWERPARFDFFDSSGSLVHSQEGGIRTHGDFSRSELPRSLNLYTRVEYDQTDSFGFAPFASDYVPQRIVLNSGGNATLTQFPDYMMTRLLQGLNCATILHEPYVLFLNGEYWGFYWLTEKYDEDYLNHYYGVGENNVIIIKNFGIEQGTAADYQVFEDMRLFFSETDLSGEENYRRACQLIDVESCIDYYATMIYIARNHDWPMSNEALWRVRNPLSEGQYNDGRWRWLLFDFNSPCMREAEHDTLNYVIERDPLFASLWKNDTFREAFIRKLRYIGENLLAAEKVDAFIREYTDTMMPILEKSWARFYGSGNNRQESFLGVMEDHRFFFNNRLAVVESWFQ